MASSPTYKQFGYVDTYADLPATADDGQLIMTRDTKATFIFDAAVPGWMPLARLVVKKGTVTVDGKVAATTKIYTLEPSNLKFYPIQVVLRAVNVAGATLKPSLSAGTNSPDYDNIATGSLLNSLTTLLGITSSPQSVSTSPALSGGTDIFVKVGTAAVATSYSFKVDIIGYYES